MTSLNPQALRRLRDAFQQQIDDGRLPGAVMLIGLGGEVAFTAALGRRDPAQPDPMPLDAYFRIYSMTKPLVSLAALMLAEEGRLALTDPLSKHLPMFANPTVAVEHDGVVRRVSALREPTVHDLLRHTAGFTYEFLGRSSVQRDYSRLKLDDVTRSREAFCTALAGVPLAFQPGSRWAYSRATDVLGAVLEVVSGQALGTLLQERLFAPLGMRETAFHLPPAQAHRLAQPFAACPDSGAAVLMMDAHHTPVFSSGGGGLVSTAADYVRFLQLLHHRGTLDGRRIVSRKTLEWMSADHLGRLPVHGEMLPPGHGFGLGLAVRLAAGLAPLPGSPGQVFWSGIGGTLFFVDPAEGLFALLLTQAPNQRIEFRNLFRHLVYAAID